MVSSSRPSPSPPPSELQLLQELQSLALSLHPSHPAFKKKALARAFSLSASILPLHLPGSDSHHKLSNSPASLAVAPSPQLGSHDGMHLSEKLEVSQRQWQQHEKRFWKWKPFRAIAHISQQRFHVLFSLHVHSIEGLPASMNGLRLIVQWSRKEGCLQTMASRVFQERAEFDETLRQRCTVYCSKTTNHGIKYEPKLFTLSILAVDVAGMGFGKYHLDLSRLMPQYPGGMEDDDRLSSWTTDFELTGKAKGSTLVVTFKYDVVHREIPGENAMRKRSGSKRSELFFSRLPNSANGSPCTTPSNPLVSPSRSGPTVGCDNDLAVDHLRNPSALEDSFSQSRVENDPTVEDTSSPNRVESATEDSSSPSSQGGLGTQFEFRTAFKYIPRVDEQLDFTFPAMQSVETGAGHNNQDAPFFRCEDEINLLEWGKGRAGNATGVDEKCYLIQSEGEEYDQRKSERSRIWENWRNFQEPEKVTNSVSKSDSLVFAISFRDNVHGEASTSGQNLRGEFRTTNAEAELDEEVDLVASEFLSNLDVGSDNEPDSPRARLLKQFEQEALLEGGIGATFNTAGASEDQSYGTAKEEISQGSAITSSKEEPDQHWGFEDALELASLMEAVELDLQKATEIILSKSRGNFSEEDETQTMLEQWGLS